VEKVPCVYILAKASHGTFYTGVTSNLVGRVWQHREGLVLGFTQKHHIKRLCGSSVMKPWTPQSCEKKGSRGGRDPGSTTLSMNIIQRGATSLRELHAERHLGLLERRSMLVPAPALELGDTLEAGSRS
jgi:hypothetical protein